MLSYTKKLARQINLYDKLAKKAATNPFAKPLNITIIWVDKIVDK